MSPNRKRAIANSRRQGSCFNIYPTTKCLLIFHIYAQVAEVTDDEEWEFDTPQPSWLKKLIEERCLLISKDDPITTYKSSLK